MQKYSELPLIMREHMRENLYMEMLELGDHFYGISPQRAGA